MYARSIANCSPADAAVEKIATVLRLLYIHDLRQLQTAIDRMVVEVQVRACLCLPDFTVKGEVRS
jgi:hypothetical protein